MGMPIRVAISATSPLCFEGLVRILRGDPTLSIVPDMLTMDKLPVYMARREADIALIHVSDGISSMSWIQIEQLCPNAKVVLLLPRPHSATVTRALAAGVMGILTEGATRTPAVFEAVHAVAAGSLWCEPDALSQNGHPPSPCPSPREGEVLALIRRGLSNRTIADRLCISERTVKSHVNRLFQKFQLTNRVQLAIGTEHRPPDPV